MSYPPSFLLFSFSGLGSCEHPQGQEEQKEAAAAVVVGGGETFPEYEMRRHFQTVSFSLFFQPPPPPPSASFSSFSLHNMAASTLASDATAATSLPPAVRVRLYELFVQVRGEATKAAVGDTG